MRKTPLRDTPAAARPEAVAALLDQPCPAGANAFLYVDCLPGSELGYRRGSCDWPAVRDAYLSLDRETRRAVRNAGRAERIRVHRLRREHLEWLASR